MQGITGNSLTRAAPLHIIGATTFYCALMQNIQLMLNGLSRQIMGYFFKNLDNIYDPTTKGTKKVLQG